MIDLSTLLVDAPPGGNGHARPMNLERRTPYPDCERCDLHKEADSVCVWGTTVGPGTPTVMVVGEAPGYFEDQADEPFVGKSGQLLTAALAEAGIETYYKTNVTKCFPSVTRTPKTPHIKACADYLEQEIALIRPAFILTLGNIPTQRILGYGKITEIAGKEVKSDRYGAVVYPAFHPAFILRQMGREDSWKADILRFGMMVRGSLKDRPPVEVDILEYAHDLPWVIEELHEHVEAGYPISYDVEATYGLDWWQKGYEVYTLAIGFSPQRAVVIPLMHKESPFAAHVPWLFKKLRPDLERLDRVRCAHNALYDDLAIYRVAGYLPKNTWDTMVAWHLLDENSLKRLKYLARTRLGYPDYGIDTRDLGNEPLQKVGFYNGCDAAATLGLQQLEREKLEQMPDVFRYFGHFVMPAIRALIYMVRNGCYLNPDILAERMAIAKRMIAEATEAIQTVSEGVVENPGSTQQVARWFYGKLKMPVIKLTPAGAPSTDEDVINRLAARYPEARLVVDYRRPSKDLNTYFENDLKKIETTYDGIPHFEYRTTSVETGRLGSEFHTRPRKSFTRNVVDAPDGWTLVSADAAQIEARLAAWAAVGKPKDWAGVPKRSMLWAFHEGRDIYVETAANVLAKPMSQVTKDKSDPNNDRQIMGKVPTLAKIYKISARGLQEYVWAQAQIEWDLAWATHVAQVWDELWPEFPLWHRQEERVLRSRGWARSALGRIRHLPDALSDDYRTADAAVRSGINMPIQGLASDFVWTSLILTTDEGPVPEEFLAKARACFFHHDAIGWRVRDDYVEQFTANIPYVMENVALRYLAPLGLKLPPGLLKVDVTTGPWGGKWNGDYLR